MATCWPAQAKPMSSGYKIFLSMYRRKFAKLCKGTFTSKCPRAESGPVCEQSTFMTYDATWMTLDGSHRVVRRFALLCAPPDFQFPDESSSRFQSSILIHSHRSHMPLSRQLTLLGPGHQKCTPTILGLSIQTCIGLISGRSSWFAKSALSGSVIS
jgi:hypothetical protein